MTPLLPARLDIIQEIEAQTIASTLDTVDYFVHGRRNRIFVLASGGGSVQLRDDPTLVLAPALIWTATGTTARISLNAGTRGAWLALSDEALNRITLPGNIADDLRRLSGQAMFGGRTERELATRLVTLVTSVEQELRESRPGAQEMLRHQLPAIAILLWRISGLIPSNPQPAPRALVTNFLQLVEQQSRSHWLVADYARYLGVSTDRLASAVQRATGKSPLAVVHQRLMLEACQMLESSSMQIAEIAAFLGFEDPAYFSRFFKRMSGNSPRLHRTSFMRKHFTSSGSFAAWP